MALAEDICALVDYACDCDLIGSEDRVWAYNSVLEAVGATSPAPAEAWLADDRYPVLPVGVAKYGSDDPDAAQPYEGAACLPRSTSRARSRASRRRPSRTVRPRTPPPGATARPCG